MNAGGHWNNHSSALVGGVYLWSGGRVVGGVQLYRWSAAAVVTIPRCPNPSVLTRMHALRCNSGGCVVVMADTRWRWTTGTPFYPSPCSPSLHLSVLLCLRVPDFSKSLQKNIFSFISHPYFVRLLLSRSGLGGACSFWGSLPLYVCEGCGHMHWDAHAHPSLANAPPSLPLFFLVDARKWLCRTTRLCAAAFVRLRRRV